MSEHQHLVDLLSELNWKMECLRQDIQELREGVKTPVSRNHNTQTKWMCPDGHVSSGTKYKMYCASKGLDPWLAIRIV
jgi:hypothetical protein